MMIEWILNYWIEIVFGLICTGFGIGFKSIFKRIKDQKLESDAIKLGIQALLRGNIITLYNKYMEKGYMPIYERENLEHLTTEYYALNGNGVVHSLVEKLDKLPTQINDNDNEIT